MDHFVKVDPPDAVFRSGTFFFELIFSSLAAKKSIIDRFRGAFDKIYKVQRDMCKYKAVLLADNSLNSEYVHFLIDILEVL